MKYLHPICQKIDFVNVVCVFLSFEGWIAGYKNGSFIFSLHTCILEEGTLTPSRLVMIKDMHLFSLTFLQYFTISSIYPGNSEAKASKLYCIVLYYIVNISFSTYTLEALLGFRICFHVLVGQPKLNLRVTCFLYAKRFFTQWKDTIRIKTK